jgi:hypothetical protein
LWQNSKNQTWVIEAGDDVIQKRLLTGDGSLTTKEKLIYCLWVADYGMRNAGDLAVAYNLYPNFHEEGAQCSKMLGLTFVAESFMLPRDQLERQYFARFEQLCNEIKSV